MNRSALALLAATLAVTIGMPAFAQAACNYPAEITLPGGKTATEEQMAAGQKAVKEYLGALEAYQVCLDDEEKALGEAVTDEQKAVHVKRYNAAVDAMNAIAARYNEEVRNFKARKK